MVSLLKRLFGRTPAAPPMFDLSESNLRHVLGDANVVAAWGCTLESAPARVEGRDQIGGIPETIGTERWPRCPQCACAMTFIGQLAAGPDDPVRYSERGSLAIFLCNSEPPTIEQLCETSATGSTCMFVAEAERANEPMFSPAQRQAIDDLVARTHDAAEQAPRLPPFLLPANAGWRARPILHHAYRAQVTRVLSCNQPASTGPQYDFWYAHERAVDMPIKIGGFAEWVQAPIDDLVCTCGAPMELVLQFEEFDEAINLGGSGRAYVFGCQRRCSPTAFQLHWQTS